MVKGFTKNRIQTNAKKKFWLENQETPQAFGNIVLGD